MRDKLDKKANAGIFISYSSTSKAAYRIYLPEANKIIRSRDVQFFESENWNWEGSKRFEIQEENEDIDDEPVRWTRSLSDVHQR